MIFNKNMKNVLDTYEKWWAGELNRPLIPIVISGLEPDREPPKNYTEGLGINQKSFGNINISPEEFIDAADYEFSHMEFIGDAYPMLDCTFSGPGIVAAFLGAKLNVETGNIWFYTDKRLPIEELHFDYIEDNFWLNRIKAIMTEGKRRWGDRVIIGLPDLGGVVDILATFRGSENLLMDLYDSPDEVIRAVNEIKLLWHRYYDELRNYTTPGLYTDWSRILSSKRSYMMQCDFSYMLGKDMYIKFIHDELVDTCKFLDRGCYHLDGVGQIPFLDDMLKINGMDLIQWVPGSGPYENLDWFDLFCKVLDAGKHLQIMFDSDYKGFDSVISHYGSGKKIIRGLRYYDVSERDHALSILSKYGIK